MIFGFRRTLDIGFRPAPTSCRVECRHHISPGSLEFVSRTRLTVVSYQCYVSILFRFSNRVDLFEAPEIRTERHIASSTGSGSTPTRAERTAGSGCRNFHPSFAYSSAFVLLILFAFRLFDTHFYYMSACVFLSRSRGREVYSYTPIVRRRSSNPIIFNVSVGRHMADCRVVCRWETS